MKGRPTKALLFYFPFPPKSISLRQIVVMIIGKSQIIGEIYRTTEFVFMKNCPLSAMALDKVPSGKLLSKCCLVCILLITWQISLSAQDIITKKDGTDIKADVLEISSDEVKYKLFEDPDGVIYIDRKSDIVMIQYESGRREIFTDNSYSDLYTTDREPAVGIVPNMRYKQLRHMYNHKEYTKTLGDRHSPAWSGVASFFIPGLGQMICGEIGRGFAFLGGHVGGIVLGSLVYASGYDPSGNYSSPGAALVAMAIFAGVFAVDIISIVDGVRVARVKNMYEQDLRKLHSMNVKLYPSVDYAYINGAVQPAAGLTLALNF